MELTLPLTHTKYIDECPLHHAIGVKWLKNTHNNVYIWTEEKGHGILGHGGTSWKAVGCRSKSWEVSWDIMEVVRRFVGCRGESWDVVGRRDMSWAS